MFLSGSYCECYGFTAADCYKRQRAMDIAGDFSTDGNLGEFTQAALVAALGEQLQPRMVSPAAASSMAYICLFVGAAIGYKHPTKVRAIYIHEFGVKGGKLFREMAAAIAQWADSSGGITLNDLPILKKPTENAEALGELHTSEAAQWAGTALRYGLVLGATHPHLFRDLWERTKSEERRMIKSFVNTGVPIPEDVTTAVQLEFEEAIEAPSQFLEFYEIEFHALPVSQSLEERSRERRQFWILFVVLLLLIGLFVSVVILVAVKAAQSG